MSKKGSQGSLQRNNRAASNAAIATANAASTAANAAGATVAVVTKKKEMVLSRPSKGIGDITVEECLEMQRACGYGGPHVQTRLEKVSLSVCSYLMIDPIFSPSSQRICPFFCNSVLHVELVNYHALLDQFIEIHQRIWFIFFLCECKTVPLCH